MRIFTLFILLLPLPTLSQFTGTQILTETSNSITIPEDVEYADFNGDGFMDVVHTPQGNLYFGIGAGNFEFAGKLGDQITEAECADIDQDGDVDIIAFSQFQLLIVAKNDGNGGFAEFVEYSGPWTDQEEIELDDLNGDLFPDVVVTSANDGWMSYALNDGSGGLLPWNPLVENITTGLRCLDLADLDGDNDVDIVWGATNNDLLSWFENDGFGAFSGPTTISSSVDQIWEIITEDHDNDGDQDIFAIGQNIGVKLFVNDGDAEFEMESVATNIAGASCLAYVDVSNDGLKDIVVGKIGNDPGLQMILNDGTNGFLAPIESEFISAIINDIEVADMNSDGNVDMLIPLWLYDALCVVPGPAFQQLRCVDMHPDNFGSYSPDFADIDGDGFLDMLTSSTLTGTSIFHGSGPMTFDYRIPIISIGQSTPGSRFINFDDDEALEIVVNSVNELMVIDTDEFGNYRHPVSLLDGFLKFELVDFDNDDDLDVLTVEQSPTRIKVAENLGGLTLAEPIAVSETLFSAAGITLTTGDINGDELPDIAFSHYSTHLVAYVINEGDWTFGEQIVIDDELTQLASGVKLADLNGDLIDDLVYSSYQLDQVIWSPALGDGTFTGPILIDVLDGVALVDVLDWDGDGSLDVVATGQWDNAVMAYLNDGNGSFDESMTLMNYVAPANLDFYDLDGDGDLDLLESTYNDEENVDYLIAHLSYGSQGCTDPGACNYQPELTDDDGSCCYGICGCTDSEACNFEAGAECDDLSCLYPGCLDPEACNYAPGATCVGACLYGIDVCGECGGNAEVVGCTDPEACNYHPDADCGAYCNYPGCTAPEACNYDPFAGCDDGSCLFIGSISGYVFEDFDGDGEIDLQNFWSLENGMMNWQVTIEELGWVAWTDDDGYFEFEDLPFGEYTVTVVDIQEGWSVVDTISADVVIDQCPDTVVQFPLEWDSESAFYLSGPCCIWMMDLHCEFGMNPGLWLHNTGGIPLNGEVTVSFDPVLSAVPMGGEAEDPTSIEPGIVTWDLNDFPLPGDDQLFQCHIEGPGVDFIGQIFTITIALNLVDENDESIFYNEWHLYPEVVCSYDPNDKYTAEPGYTDEHHFILQENELEYRIRFQNTGNFPAQDVVIQDTLDLEHLDIESFHPLFGSHDFSTTLKPDGAIAFTFSDIELPDSTCCFDESQGYVVYRVSPRDEVDPGDVINNTAYIFFDSNPAIVTNTTWHTIYECTDEFANFTSDGEDVCLNDSLQFVSDQPFVESYDWTVNGSSEGDEQVFNFIGAETGLATVGLQAINPLCTATAELEVEVYALPYAGFDQNGNELYYSGFDAVTYQWYLNGEAIAGATESFLNITEDGNYSLEVVGSFGCVNVSEEVFITHLGIDSMEQGAFEVFPNPTTDMVWITFEDHRNRALKLIGPDGRLVEFWTVNKTEITLDLSGYAAGVYILATDKNETMKLILE